MNLCAVARETVEFVHADRFADHFQIERLEAPHALDQEGILTPHDLGGDIQDGARALLEALGEPVGRLELSGDILPVLLPLCAATDLGGVNVVDQHARQRLTVELNPPDPVGLRGHVDVGDRRPAGRIAKRAARLRLETPDLADHVAQVVVVDAAQSAQQRIIPSGERGQILDQSLHRRIETVAFAQLQGQALGEIAGEHARRLKRLHANADLFDDFEAGPEPLGDFRSRTDKIAGLVQPVDERGADQPLRGVDEQDRRLTLEMIAKRKRLANIGFEVRRVAGIKTAPDAGP